jgi:hypothetical protein
MELSHSSETACCSRISQQFIEPEGLLPTLQELSTGSYPEPD